MKTIKRLIVMRIAASFSNDEGTEVMVVYSTAVENGACMGAYTDCARRAS